MLGSLAAKPLRSFPAMGWPPTKMYPPVRSSIPAQTAVLTPQVSVSTQPSRSFGPCSRAKSRAAPGYTHRYTISALLRSSIPALPSMAPQERASRRESSLVSMPSTWLGVFCFRAFAMEPPIIPRPTIIIFIAFITSVPF